MFWCKHKWIEVKRRFTQPVRITKARGFYDEFEVSKLIMGFTTVESRCAKCNKLLFEEVIGDKTNG